MVSALRKPYLTITDLCELTGESKNTTLRRVRELNTKHPGLIFEPRVPRGKILIDRWKLKKAIPALFSKLTSAEYDELDRRIETIEQELFEHDTEAE